MRRGSRWNSVNHSTRDQIKEYEINCITFNSTILYAYACLFQLSICPHHILTIMSNTSLPSSAFKYHSIQSVYPPFSSSFELHPPLGHMIRQVHVSIPLIRHVLFQLHAMLTRLRKERRNHHHTTAYHSEQVEQQTAVRMTKCEVKCTTSGRPVSESGEPGSCVDVIYARDS